MPGAACTFLTRQNTLGFAGGDLVVSRGDTAAKAHITSFPYPVMARYHIVNLC